MTYQAYWKKLQEIGWLDYVPAEEQADLRARLQENLKRKDRPEWAFLTLSHYGFDSECIDGIGPDSGSYHREHLDLAANSRGLFHPVDLKDEFVKRERAIKVSFQHDDKAFSCTVPYEGDYFDEAVLELVNQALEASGVRERFINLPTVDQCYYLVLVPPSIYEAAVRAKLIPKQEDLEPPDDD